MASKTRGWIGRLAALAAAFVVVLMLWKLLPIDDWLTIAAWRMFDLGAWGVLIYFLLYVFLAGLTFPTTPLNIVAGILFSFWLAAGVALAAGFVTAAGCFLIGRYIAEEGVRTKLRRLPNFDNLMKLIEDAGLKLVFLVRLNPFIPAGLKNYGFSLTSISFRQYLLGTLLGQTPITLAHVYLGWAGGLAMIRDDDPPGTWQYVFLGLGAALSIALLLLISWYGNRRLKVSNA